MKQFLFIIAALITATATANAEDTDFWSMSYTYEAEGKYQAAAALIEKNLNKSADKEFALIRYAWLNYLLGNYDDSISNYQKAIAINPDSIDAKLGITLPLLASQKYSKTKRYAKQVLEVSPWNYTAHMKIILCEQAQKRWATLKSHTQALIKHYPTDTTLQVFLARAYANLDEGDNAVKTYKKVLIRYPGHYEALNYINQ
ncbi:MAG: tetratricopeptide repeat protein [Gammaproteobacteria bacterium]|nr:MAG: tetratricopeptide repeat protein [Gammaproteobacteria bacterium]